MSVTAVDADAVLDDAAAAWAYLVVADTLPMTAEERTRIDQARHALNAVLEEFGLDDDDLREALEETVLGRPPARARPPDLPT